MTGPYTVEFISAERDSNGVQNWRIADRDDNRIATCFAAVIAQELVDKLNDMNRSVARWRAITSTKVNQTIRGEYAAPMYGLKAESLEKLADAIIQGGEAAGPT